MLTLALSMFNGSVSVAPIILGNSELPVLFVCCIRALDATYKYEIAFEQTGKTKRIQNY